MSRMHHPAVRYLNSIILNSIYLLNDPGKKLTVELKNLFKVFNAAIQWTIRPNTIFCIPLTNFSKRTIYFSDFLIFNIEYFLSFYSGRCMDFESSIKRDHQLIQTLAASIRQHNYHTKAYINQKYAKVL